jgi:hypothetical protein
MGAAGPIERWLAAKSHLFSRSKQATQSRWHIWGPRIIATNRQAPRIYPRMIPLCSRFDSVLFTPKMSAIASCGNYSRFPYVFGRRYGRNFEALYVGKATELHGRIKGQLKNLPLMLHLKKATSGKRVVLTGRFVARPGQQPAKCLSLIERSLIRYFLSEGHDLVNKQGTRLRRHEINSRGNQPKRFIPRLMYLDRAKGE